MLKLENIKKYYEMGKSTVKALDDVSLEIGDGEFVAIIGPSGSGKSTLMNIMGCLDVATSGEYYVDDVAISSFDDNALALFRSKKIGFVFQGFNLLPRLDAIENVELPLIYQRVQKKQRHALAIEALKKVGLFERQHHKPTELSGGQQQRVAIARALVTSPSVILADEPTGNLDSKVGLEVLQILKDLNKSGVTVVLITHDDEIARHAKRIVSIKDGKIESDVLNEFFEEECIKLDEQVELNRVQVIMQEERAAQEESAMKGETIESLVEPVEEKIAEECGPVEKEQSLEEESKEQPKENTQPKKKRNEQKGGKK